MPGRGYKQHVVQSRLYRELAELAARQQGLVPATAEAAAEDPGARDVRDSYWLELDRRLRDTQTFTLDELVAWLKGLGCKVSRSSVDRARQRELARERQFRLRAELARATVEAAGEGGEHDTLRAGRIVAGQLLFDALSGLSVEALEGLTASQVLRLIDTLGGLSKAHVETALLAAKVEELRRKFDEQVKTASDKTGDGRLTADQIAEIRAAVFGAAA
ncbi:MAG: phage protein Gp27 family protein [Planctomycetota bacterium]|jgi:hypothetical protein